mgnify:CR=1 FL=1
MLKLFQSLAQEGLEHILVHFEFVREGYQQLSELTDCDVLELCDDFRDSRCFIVIKREVVDCSVGSAGCQPLNQKLILKIAVEGTRAPVASRDSFGAVVKTHDIEAYEGFVKLPVEILLVEFGCVKPRNSVNSGYPRILDTHS